MSEKRSKVVILRAGFTFRSLKNVLSLLTISSAQVQMGYSNHFFGVWMVHQSLALAL